MEIKYENQEAIYCNHQYDDKYTTIVFDNLINAKILLQFPKPVPSLADPSKLIAETSVPIIDNKWTISRSYLKHSGVIYAQIVENIEGRYVKHGDIFKLIVDKSLGNGEPIEDIPFQFKSKFDEMVKIINDVQTKLDNGEFNGKSAYEIAVNNGFKGTEQEWLESLDYEHSQEFTDLANQVRTDSQQVSQDKIHVDEIAKQVDSKANEVSTNATQVAKDKTQVSKDKTQVSQDKAHVDTVVKEFDAVTTQANKNFTDKVTQANSLFDTKVLNANQGIDTKVSEFDTKVSEANIAFDGKIKQANTELDTKVKQASDSAVQAQTSADSVSASAEKIDKNATDITQLKQDLTKLGIKDKSSGNPCVISDSADWKLQGLNIYGQSEQNGTPTLDAPVPIINKEVSVIKVTDKNSSPNKEQTVTLSKPIMLRGIPVSKDGNVTINGQQYVSDEINSNIEHVNKIKRITLDGSETWYTWGANTNGNIGFYYYPNTLGNDSKIKGNHCISNYLPYNSGSYNGNKIGVNVITGSDVTLTYIVVSLKQSELADVSSNELAIKSFKYFLANKKANGVPFEIYCQLLKPIVTSLSETDQKAIKALKAYYPNTVIQTGALTEATYIADPKLFIEKQHQGIQSQIHELQANLITAKISGGSNNAIVINDSSNMKIKSIKMYGQSEQAKYNGINLIDFSKAKSNVGNVEIKRNGNQLSIVNNNNYVAIVDIPMNLDIGTYYISASSSSSIPIYRNNKWFANGILGNLKKGKFEVIEQDVYVARITVQTQSGLTIDSLMCSTLETAVYEPYTGGKPSPSPEYPQDIISKKISEIKITGSNLLTNDDVAGQGTVNLSICKTKGVYLEKGITYVLSLNGQKAPTAIYLIPFGENKEVSQVYNNLKFKFTVQNSGRYWFKVYDKNLEFQNEWISSLRLNIKKDYGYESYKEQVITLSSPITLRGIPVTENGNVTINGQQYVSDILCEKDGVIGVERNCEYIKNYMDEIVGDTYISTTGELSIGAGILYKLETPTFEPLPLIDQQAIRNLTSYYPITNIYVDTYSEVEYIADTKNYIDNKITGISTALMKGV